MATRYLVPGGNGNYDSTSNWSATDGGASGATFPVAVDDIIINANSLNAPLVINVVSACKSFNASSYTGTVSMNSDLSVEGTAALGDITLSSGMTITGSGTFSKKGTSTTGRITSNGVIFDCNFSFTNTVACTTLISGAMQVNGDLSSTLNSTTTTTINTGTISVGGNIIHNNPLAGTSTIQLIGTNPATITQVATRYLGTNLIINKGAGAFNPVNLYWGDNSRTLTYTSGIVNHTGVLFVLSNAILNTSSMTWNVVTPGGTLNLTSVCNTDRITRNGNLSSFSFTGIAGFNTNYFETLNIANSSTVQFTNNIQYNINISLVCINTAPSSNSVFKSISGTAIINLKENAVMKIDRFNLQGIRASNKTLRTLRSTVTNCTNCFKIDSNINQYSKTK